MPFDSPLPGGNIDRFHQQHDSYQYASPIYPGEYNREYLVVKIFSLSADSFSEIQ